MAPQACDTCSLSLSGCCCHPFLQQATAPVLLPSRGLAPEARQARAGGHGVHLAPTCNRGALVFVSCSLARAPQMSGVARLFPCPSSLHGRVQPGLAPSPLGREEGSTRAQAPPQPRTSPWPGHEHSAPPGEQATGPLQRGSNPHPRLWGPSQWPRCRLTRMGLPAWQLPPVQPGPWLLCTLASLRGREGWGRAPRTPPRVGLVAARLMAQGLLGHSPLTQASFSACTGMDTHARARARRTIPPHPAAVTPSRPYRLPVERQDLVKS